MSLPDASAPQTWITSRSTGIGVSHDFTSKGLSLVPFLAFTRSLRSMIYEMTPADPLTFVQLAVAMSLVGVAAAYGPAARAAATDPMSVLRQE